MAHNYSSARAFRTALEDRLMRRARVGGLDHRRLRNQVAFERLLARLFAEQTAPAWILKGGFALELRLGGKARATRDLDLAIPAPVLLAPADDQQLAAIVEQLHQAAGQSLGDWFVYQLSDPLKELATPPYGGATLLVTASLDQRVFARFHLDVGLGDVVVGPAEWLEGSDLCAFAGLAPARVAVLPPAQQFAEKVHAYTLPRGLFESTRTKDLVDVLLLLTLGLPEPPQVRQALQATFARRQTHPLPQTLPPPPAAWRPVYQQYATALGLAQTTLDVGYAVVAAFWQTLALSGEGEPEAREGPEQGAPHR